MYFSRKTTAYLIQRYLVNSYCSDSRSSIAAGNHGDLLAGDQIIWRPKFLAFSMDLNLPLLQELDKSRAEYFSLLQTGTLRFISFLVNVCIQPAEQQDGCRCLI